MITWDIHIESTWKYNTKYPVTLANSYDNYYVAICSMAEWQTVLATPGCQFKTLSEAQMFINVYNHGSHSNQPVTIVTIGY